MIEFLAFLATGAVAGILAGLLGVGGGLFIVPVLLFLLPLIGIHSTELITISVATSLATIVLTSISSVRAHHKRGAVKWRLFWWLTPGLVIGAWSGAFIADWLPAFQLTAFFGVAVILIGLQMFFSNKISQQEKAHKPVEYSLAGIFIGIISALIGIGGGSMTVPLLHYWRETMVKAVATSAACGLPIALASTAGFIVAGWNKPGLPEQTIGYVYWPAAVMIVISSFTFAPVGAKWAHQVNGQLLKKFFAVFLILVGIKVLSGLLF
jgi:uncharacterized membrane protein YfcA